jgi:hypothetical protein
MRAIPPLHRPSQQQYDAAMRATVLIFLTPVPLSTCQQNTIAREWCNIPKWFDGSWEAEHLHAITGRPHAKAEAEALVKDIVETVGHHGCAIIYGVFTPEFRAVLDACPLPNCQHCQLVVYEQSVRSDEWQCIRHR